MSRTPAKFSRVQSDDPAVNRIQDQLLAQNSGILNNPALAMADWRTTQVGSGSTSTWCLQYRTAAATWTTVATVPAVLVWTSLTLVNSWVNNAAGNALAEYARDAFGRVSLRGLIKSGVADTIATLPLGYRPPLNRTWAVDAGGAYGRVTVTSAGVIQQDVGSKATGTALDTISFDTVS